MIIRTKVNSEAKMRRSTITSPLERCKRLSIAASVISVVLISATIMLAPMASDSFAQGANNTSSNANQGTVAGGSKLNCQSIASTIGGIVVPNPSNICDVLIPRQAPTIIGPGNMNMNKFSTINSIVEVASVSDLMTKSKGGGGAGGTSTGASSGNNTNAQKVFVMAEFSLLEPQLVPMVKAAVDSNWTIAAVHNHMILEKPKMMFVHWSAQGDLNTIMDQIKNVLLTVSKVPTSGSSS
jgi:Domain of Unknown Function (DUF1259)